MYAKNMKSSRGQAPFYCLHWDDIVRWQPPAPSAPVGVCISRVTMLGKFPCLKVGVHHGLRGVTGVSFAGVGVWEMNICVENTVHGPQGPLAYRAVAYLRSDGRISPPRAGGEAR